MAWYIFKLSFIIEGTTENVLKIYALVLYNFSEITHKMCHFLQQPNVFWNFIILKHLSFSLSFIFCQNFYFVHLYSAALCRPLLEHSKVCLQCLQRDRLDVPNVNKNDIIQGTGKLGKNDVTWGQAKSTAVPPDQKVNKAQELTYLPTNIEISQLTDYALLPATSIKFFTDPRTSYVLSKRCIGQRQQHSGRTLTSLS